MSVKGVFASANERRDYGAGDVIFSEGDTSEHMFGVVSGAVELRKGDEVLLTVGPEATFGELGVIDGTSRSLSAVAVEPTTVAVIDERTFLYMVQETPMFAIQVMKSLAARIRQLD
jgi:CRP/FNR family transcriptional regulator, cyclic AMP receptor protein